MRDVQGVASRLIDTFEPDCVIPAAERPKYLGHRPSRLDHLFP